MAIKVLMVCLGNICRSPLAEGILQSKLNKNDCIVDSAGTANYHIGKTPDKRSVAIANKFNIDISNQKCRQFSKTDFKDFDYIFAMDKNNYNDIIKLASNNIEKSKVKLILEHSKLDLIEVPDPYYGDESDFEFIYHLLNDACEVIKDNIILKN